MGIPKKEEDPVEVVDYLARFSRDGTANNPDEKL
jgi:hypothetical protein